MSYRNYQVDMSYPISPHFLLGYLNSTSVADDPSIADALVLTTGTFIIFHWPEDPLAEQTITLRFVRTVIYGFRLQDFSP